MKKLFYGLLLLSTSVCFALPKYAPETQPLNRAHNYLTSHPSPDFWSLIPYYAAQQNEASCSVASVTMLINAIRSRQDLSSEERLVTQSELLKKVKNDFWAKAVSEKVGFGVTLDQLGDLIQKSLKAYGIEKAQVLVTHVPLKRTPEFIKKFHQLLLENEKSSKNYLIINFDQKIYTGDAPVGHFAPVGAFDPANNQVLVLDPDRTWYEPYWVSEERLLNGMATHDSASNQTRGYIYIEF